MASAPCSPSLAAAAAVGRGPRPRSAAVPGGGKKLTCLCSPTNHPGSFRCSRHRNGPAAPGAGGEAGPGPRGRVAAKGGGGGGRSVRALLLQRISSPSDRDRQRQRRRSGEDFQPRPSRLRLMNM
ncbi:unnamed protein product [Urochloa decumbens]|uniref:Serine-rich protein n=1 Tax=Urochloa decumbens TaxID=240449 RepID=A0ABC8V882_9POAL